MFVGWYEFEKGKYEDGLKDYEKWVASPTVDVDPSNPIAIPLVDIGIQNHRSAGLSYIDQQHQAGVSGVSSREVSEAFGMANSWGSSIISALKTTGRVFKSGTEKVDGKQPLHLHSITVKGLEFLAEEGLATEERKLLLTKTEIKTLRVFGAAEPSSMNYIEVGVGVGTTPKNANVYMLRLRKKNMLYITGLERRSKGRIRSALHRITEKGIDTLKKQDKGAQSG